MVPRLLGWLCAVLLAAGLVVSQIFLGGWWYPALAAPGYLLAGAAALTAGLLCWKIGEEPGAWCVGVTLLFAGYLIWRQSESPDPYAARDDFWLLMASLSVYLTAAWQMRAPRQRGFVVGAMILMAVVQTSLALAQFASAKPFHPFGDLAPDIEFLRIEGQTANQGWVTGTLASRGSLSAVLLVPTFLSLGFLLWARVGVALKLILLWTTAAGFVGLVLSLSRSAYLGSLAGLAVFAATSFFIIQRGALAHRGLLLLALPVLACIFLGAALLTGWESLAVQMRVWRIGLDEFREQLWFEALPPMLRLDPWLGAGANMFDQLSLRYRGGAFNGRPYHAHNDWLQLLVEYGRIGLALGLCFFLTHIAAAWRNALRIARETTPSGLLPQDSSLAVLTGALAALVALAVHSFFDYRLHVPAAALPVALCAGWIAATRKASDLGATYSLPWWMRVLAVMPLLPGIALLWSVTRELPAEQKALEAERAMFRGDPRVAWDLTTEGLIRSPDNPRLLVLAGESAGLIGNACTATKEKRGWYERSAAQYARAVGERPFFAYGLREYALVLDWCGRQKESLPFHLRAIARDPDSGAGYEYLGVHYWTLGRNDEAARLLRLGQHFPGSRLAGEFLERIEKAKSQPPAN
ncbi:MAG: hypothetical protein FGM15_03675 [Chthoniobacterales bacterium]|nr:hypothetical protein [Chthoniobacterales bacterium]